MTSFDHSKLSPRLKELSKMLPANIQEVWDICCDHGYLGRYLLTLTRGKVNFLDQVPSIIDELDQYLRSEFSPDHFRTIMADGRSYPYKLSQTLNCFCIAGVGFYTVRDIVQQIEDCLGSHIQKQYLLLGSQKNNFKLRQWLRERGWKMNRERMVLENGHFRELWLLHLESGDMITPVGIPEDDQVTLWLDYWNEELVRMSHIQEQGGIPEIAPHLLEQQIKRYSTL